MSFRTFSGMPSRRRARSSALACALVAALALTAGCSDSDEPTTPAATAPATTEKTTTTTSEPSTPEEEVEAAYLRSWEVYTQAVRDLDDSRLAEVYAGEALALRQREIADYRAANTPGRIDVEHDYVIDVFQPDRALILDSYFNKSVFLDAETGDPIEDVPNEVVHRQYELRRGEGGTWLVVQVQAVE
jgi:hypothetical protein